MTEVQQPASTTVDQSGLAHPQLLQIYDTMLRIRRFEERVKELFLAAHLYGSVHLYVGEEAIAAGACATLRPGDVISSTHRGHGHCIARGLSLDRMMAELMGKVTGYNFGKGGSMHIASLDHGMLGANGIVAAGIPIATGAALGFWIRGQDNVALCFFGDGGANHGAFHEGINLAATLKLPVIFICENNHWAQYQSVSQDLPIAHVAGRADAYGIPGCVVDGADVLAVYAATASAVQRARAGEGPSLIEAAAERFEGHFLGDPEVYRSKEEVAKARTTRDPLVRFGRLLEHTGVATATALQQCDEAVLREVDAAVAFAEASPEPGVDRLLTDVFTGADVDGWPV